MRVAYICADPGVPVFGHKGSSVHVQSVLRALQGQGASVELFAMRRGGEAPPDLAAVPVHRLPRPPKGDLEQRELGLLAANHALAEALAAAGPFDMVYERYALWSYSGLEWARASGLPALLEVNAPLIEEQTRHRGLHHLALAAASTGRAFAAASALLAVSAEVAGYLEAHPSAGGRVHLVPNGVDPSRFRRDDRPSLPGPAGSFTVGFVGTLKPWHGLDTLADAFALLRARGVPARLLLVGDGPERGATEGRLAALGLAEHVVLTGAVPPAAIPGLLRSMHVAVAPYPPLESFYFSPLKVFEYLAAGLPTVASRIGQIEQLIAHGRSGLLYPPGDVGALADALARLHADPRLAAQLGLAGRALVARSHSWDALAGRILRIAFPERAAQAA